jgi:hypothetical protein
LPKKARANSANQLCNRLSFSKVFRSKPKFYNHRSFQSFFGRTLGYCPKSLSTRASSAYRLCNRSSFSKVFRPQSTHLTAPGLCQRGPTPLIDSVTAPLFQRFFGRSLRISLPQIFANAGQLHSSFL